MSAHRIHTHRHLRRSRLQLPSVQIAQEVHEGLVPDPAARHQFTHLVPRLPSLLPTSTATAGAAAAGEEVVEEPAPRRQDAAVDANRGALDDDLGIAAIEFGGEEEALEVGAQLAEAHHLEAAPGIGGQRRRQGGGRRRSGWGSGVDAGAIGEVGGGGDAQRRRGLRQIGHGPEQRQQEEIRRKKTL